MASTQFVLRKENFEELLKTDFLEVCSQACVAEILILMVLMEAAYLKKLCDKVCLGSAWILCASVKEKKE